MEKSWKLYILRCSDGSLYTGITNDLEKRVIAHNTGKGAKYTRINKPIKIVYSKEFESKSNAMKEEARIKKLSHSEKSKLIK